MTEPVRSQAMAQPSEILDFWFPPGLDADLESHRRQFLWWFRGGANDAIMARFLDSHAAACRGELADWAATPPSRLALIILLDQFSRTIHQGTAAAYARDEAAIELAETGLVLGHYDQLATVWEKTFFLLPLGHAEQLARQERSVALCAALIDQAPAQLRPLYEFSANQARGHRDVIARFGRHPHRNAPLGRISTDDELAYLATGQLVHQRAFQTVGEDAADA